MLNILTEEDFKKYCKGLNFLSPIINSILEKEKIYMIYLRKYGNLTDLKGITLRFISIHLCRYIFNI